ncbi:putative aliphatic sulfonates-binding protein precursor [compost metagenome]
MLDELSRGEALTRSHREESIAILARFSGLAPEVLARTFEHRPVSPVGPVTDEIAAAQQRTADLFLEHRLLPRRVDIGSVVWRPQAGTQ